MPAIVLKKVSKRFGNEVIAVDEIDLSVEEGAFHTLLGPSGCGKTTTLRMIAGLEEPSGGTLQVNGQVFFDAEEHSNVPAPERNLGFIFQHYALWPHFTVFENVAFGLRVRRASRDEVKTRVAEALERVQLTGYEDRYPSELSGGQQQRVALARMQIVNPAVLLMDEPLSNLDAKLRLEMRSELKRMHLETGSTTLYVTHDQIEAMTLSTAVTVFRDGKIQQTAAPRELYREPANLFVAEFVGNFPINLLDATAVSKRGDGRWDFTMEGVGNQSLSGHLQESEPMLSPGDRVVLGLRPEELALVKDDDKDYREHVMRGRCAIILFAGSEAIVEVEVGDRRMRVRVESTFGIQPGQQVSIAILRMHVFHADSTQRIGSVNYNVS